MKPRIIVTKNDCRLCVFLDDGQCKAHRYRHVHTLRSIGSSPPPEWCDLKKKNIIVVMETDKS